MNGLSLLEFHCLAVVYCIWPAVIRAMHAVLTADTICTCVSHTEPCVCAATGTVTLAVGGAFALCDLLKEAVAGSFGALACDARYQVVGQEIASLGSCTQSHGYASLPATMERHVVMQTRATKPAGARDVMIVSLFDYSFRRKIMRLPLKHFFVGALYNRLRASPSSRPADLHWWHLFLPGDVPVTQLRTKQ